MGSDSEENHCDFNLLDGPIDDSAFFELLSDPRRRFIYQYLLKHGDTSVDEIAELIAAYETDCNDSETSERNSFPVVHLHQLHLPRMDSLKLIDYNAESGDITLTKNGEIMRDKLNQPYLLP